MFKFVLIVLTFAPNSTPQPIATFREPQMCEAVAIVANKAFAEKATGQKAICIVAMKHGEI